MAKTKHKPTKVRKAKIIKEQPPKDLVVDKTEEKNAYGVNQWTPPDPRQELFWKYYLDPKSDTFSVATKSARKAGYSEAMANQVTLTEWYIEVRRRNGLLKKAELALEEGLDIEVNVPVMGMFGPIIDKMTGQPLMKVEANLLGRKLDVAKFVAGTLGKDKGYSSKHVVEHILPTPILGGATIKDVQVRDAEIKEND